MSDIFDDGFLEFRGTEDEIRKVKAIAELVRELLARGLQASPANWQPAGGWQAGLAALKAHVTVREGFWDDVRATIQYNIATGNMLEIEIADENFANVYSFAHVLRDIAADLGGVMYVSEMDIGDAYNGTRLFIPFDSAAMARTISDVVLNIADIDGYRALASMAGWDIALVEAAFDVAYIRDEYDASYLEEVDPTYEFEWLKSPMFSYDNYGNNTIVFQSRESDFNAEAADRFATICSKVLGIRDNPVSCMWTSGDTGYRGHMLASVGMFVISERGGIHLDDTVMRRLAIQLANHSDGVYLSRGSGVLLDRCVSCGDNTLMLKFNDGNMVIMGIENVLSLAVPTLCENCGKTWDTIFMAVAQRHDKEIGDE